MLTFLLLLTPVPTVADFAILTVQDATKLEGKQVTVSLSVATPPFTFNGVTMVGTDAEDRTIYLKRGTVEQGETLRATGTLRVVRHRESRVNGSVIPAWTEIRLENAVKTFGR